MERRVCAAIVMVVMLVSSIAEFAMPTPAVAAASSPYADAVLADSPDAYYRLGDATSSTIVDSSGNGRDAIVSNAAGFTAGVAGAIGDDVDTAKSLNGQQDTYAVNPQQLANPNTFTQAVWFKTTSTTGGRIMGFGNENAQNAQSTSADRQVWMSDNGFLRFGVYTEGDKQEHIVSSAQAYNDGNWHFVVATLSSAGQRLYIDGSLVGHDASSTIGETYNGYWRLGGDSVRHWQYGPTSLTLTATFDEWAVWDSVALSDAQIKAHYSVAFYEAESTTMSMSIAPTMSFTVGGRSTACNSVTPTFTSSATEVNFGIVNPDAPQIGAQDLLVTSNASGGYVVYVQGEVPTGPRAVTSVTGSHASPAAFGSGERFGYTIDDVDVAGFGGPLWAALSSAASPVLISPSGPPASSSNCIAYQLAVTTLTPAGVYRSTATYTAVPTF